jgi:hypothetical protein
MRGPAKLSPASRKISDIEDRIKRLKQYEGIQKPTRIDFKDIVGNEKWRLHWENCDAIQNLMRDAQVLALEINKEVAEAHPDAL